MKSVQNEDKIKNLIDRYEKASDSDLESDYSDSESIQPTSNFQTTVAGKTLAYDKTAGGIVTVVKENVIAKPVVPEGSDSKTKTETLIPNKDTSGESSVASEVAYRFTNAEKSFTEKETAEKVFDKKPVLEKSVDHKTDLKNSIADRSIAKTIIAKQTNIQTDSAEKTFDKTLASDNSAHSKTVADKSAACKPAAERSVTKNSAAEDAVDHKTIYDIKPKKLKLDSEMNKINSTIEDPTINKCSSENITKSSKNHETKNSKKKSSKEPQNGIKKERQPLRKSRRWSNLCSTSSQTKNILISDVDRLQNNKNELTNESNSQNSHLIPGKEADLSRLESSSAESDNLFPNSGNETINETERTTRSLSVIEQKTNQNSSNMNQMPEVQSSNENKVESELVTEIKQIFNKNLINSTSKDDQERAESIVSSKSLQEMLSSFNSDSSSDNEVDDDEGSFKISLDKISSNNSPLKQKSIQTFNSNKSQKSTQSYKINKKASRGATMDENIMREESNEDHKQLRGIIISLDSDSSCDENDMTSLNSRSHESDLITEIKQIFNKTGSLDKSREAHEEKIPQKPSPKFFHSNDASSSKSDFESCKREEQKETKTSTDQVKNLFSTENIPSMKSTTSQNSEHQIEIGRFVIKKVTDTEFACDLNETEQEFLHQSQSAASTDIVHSLDESQRSLGSLDNDLQVGSTAPDRLSENSDASVSQNEHFPRTSTQNLPTHASNKYEVAESLLSSNSELQASNSVLENAESRISNSDSSQSQSELITSQSESELVTEIKEIFNKKADSKNDRKSSCSHKRFRKPRRPNRRSKSTNKFSSSDEVLETIDENKILESSSTESDNPLSKTRSETKSLTGSKTGSTIENRDKRTSGSIIGSEIKSATATSSMFDETTNQNSSKTNQIMDLKCNKDELKADAENLPGPIFRDVVSKKTSNTDSTISIELENSRSRKEKNCDDLVIGQSILRTTSPQRLSSSDSHLSSISDTSATSCDKSLDPVPQPVFKNFVQNAEILKSLSSLSQQKSTSSVAEKSKHDLNPKSISESSNAPSSSGLIENDFIAEMNSEIESVDKNTVDNNNGYDEIVDEHTFDNARDDEKLIDKEIGDREIVDKDIIEDKIDNSIQRSQKMSSTSKIFTKKVTNLADKNIDVDVTSKSNKGSTNVESDISDFGSADVNESKTSISSGNDTDSLVGNTAGSSTETTSTNSNNNSTAVANQDIHENNEDVNYDVVNKVISDIIPDDISSDVINGATKPAQRDLTEISDAIHTVANDTTGVSYNVNNNVENEFGNDTIYNIVNDTTNFDVNDVNKTAECSTTEVTSDTIESTKQLPKKSLTPKSPASRPLSTKSLTAAASLSNNESSEISKRISIDNLSTKLLSEKDTNTTSNKRSSIKSTSSVPELSSNTSERISTENLSTKSSSEKVTNTKTMSTKSLQASELSDDTILDVAPLDLSILNNSDSNSELKDTDSGSSRTISDVAEQSNLDERTLSERRTVSQTHTHILKNELKVRDIITFFHFYGILQIRGINPLQSPCQSDG